MCNANYKDINMYTVALTFDLMTSNSGGHVLIIFNLPGEFDYCLPSTTAPMLCRRVADKMLLVSGSFRYHISINGQNFAIWPVRHVFALA